MTETGPRKRPGDSCDPYTFPNPVSTSPQPPIYRVEGVGTLSVEGPHETRRMVSRGRPDTRFTAVVSGRVSV